jgi:stage III sporulation protein AH
MVHRKKLVFISIVALVAMGFYLQLSFDNNERIKSESTRDVIESSGSTYVSGFFEEVDFFSEAKFEREISQSKAKVAINDILSTSNITPELENKVAEKLNRLVTVAEVETKIETLVNERGYKNVFVAIAEDGSIDIVVNAPSLSQAEVSQIADIASRHANIPIQNIHIKNKF